MALKVSSGIETRVVMALDRNEVQKLKEAGSSEQFHLFANSQQSAQKLPGGENFKRWAIHVAK